MKKMIGLLSATLMVASVSVLADEAAAPVKAESAPVAKVESAAVAKADAKQEVSKDAAKPAEKMRGPNNCIPYDNKDGIIAPDCTVVAK